MYDFLAIAPPILQVPRGKKNGVLLFTLFSDVHFPYQ